MQSKQYSSKNQPVSTKDRSDGRCFWLRQSVIGIFLFMICLPNAGCRFLGRNAVESDFPVESEVPNPVVVPMMDRWLVMDQVSDELDDYFKIYREERIRVMDGVMSEGWIETHPKIGRTIFEPWHRDSTPGFERLHATLQTVRRFAKVRVIPTGNSYQVDVRVFKELEDLETPIGASVRGQGLRHDNTLTMERDGPLVLDRNEGWIPMGRDFSLEQKILANIRARLEPGLAGAGPPSANQ